MALLHVRWRSLLLVLALVPLASLQPGAQNTGSAYITLAWDANAEPVGGYRVHVGTRSGVYSTVVDVRQETTYTYRAAVPGQVYYFAVSAYSTSRANGPLSEEISAAARSTEPTIPDQPIAAVRGGASGTQTSSLMPPPTADQMVNAICEGSEQCYIAERRAGDLGEVTALAVADDETLFVVEDGRHVRVVLPESDRGAVTLAAADGSRFVDVAVAPRFSVSRHLYLGVVHERRDGTPELNIVRYRMIGESFVDRAVVLTASLAGGEPRLAIGAEGRIYVAMPSVSDRSIDPYAGRILRFNLDGTVPADARAASPVLATGFATPTSVSAVGPALLAAGLDALERPWVAVFSREGSTTNEWPLRPESVALTSLAPPVRSAADERTDAFAGAVIDAPLRLHLVGASGRDGRRLQFRDSTGWMIPTSAAIGPDRSVYVALRSLSGEALAVKLKTR